MQKIQPKKQLKNYMFKAIIISKQEQLLQVSQEGGNQKVSITY